MTSASDDEIRDIAKVVEYVESLSDEDAAAIGDRLRLICALPRNTSAVDLLADLLPMSFHGPDPELDRDLTFVLLLLIGDPEWYGRIQAPIPSNADRRLRLWSRRFGPWINELMRLNDWPDDWRRVYIQFLTDERAEGKDGLRVRLKLFKVRDAEITFEMTTDSYVNLITALLEEIPTLPERARIQVEDSSWQRLGEQVSLTAAALPTSGNTEA